MARAAVLLLAPLLTNCLTLEKFPDWALGFMNLRRESAFLEDLQALGANLGLALGFNSMGL